MAASVALVCAGTVVAGMAQASAKGKRVRRNKPTKNFVVVLCTPTNNQEVLPDLSDPGLNGVITVRFSSRPRRKDIIDNQNVDNRLTSKVEFFDKDFARLPGTPRVRGRVFIFNPKTLANNGVLPQGQYTLNLKSTLRNVFGRQLNLGQEDVTKTFTVGTDVFAPVLRRMSPLDGQTGIGLFQPIVATFNEPIEPSTVISTIVVIDASTNPPAVIPGAGGGNGVTLERGGFDVVFTPDPCFGYPALTTIAIGMQGENANIGQIASPITDLFGNTFRRDPSLRWTFDPVTLLYFSPNGSYNEGDPASFDPNLNPPQFTIPGTGLFVMAFVTKGVAPTPQGLIPGSPQLLATPTAAPCAVQIRFAPSCVASGNVIFFTNNNGLGEIDLRGFISRFNQGITDLSLLSVLPNTPQRMGRPGGMVIDPRWDAAPVNPADTFHTFMYLVDQRTATVLVLDSRTLKTLGRFTGFSSPRDVSISTNLGLNATTLWVSDFASNQVIGIDLQGIAVDFSGQPGGQTPCDAITDNQGNRVFVSTGRGPTGIAADSFLQSRLMVCNTLDDSVTMINVPNATVLNTFTVGSTPVDCDWTIIGFGLIRSCMIANQGGLNDPDGSISLYLNAPPLSGGFLGAGQTRDGIEVTYTDQVKNPVDVHGNQQWLNPFSGSSVPQNFLIPNTGAKDFARYGLGVNGIIFGLSISPSVLSRHDVGFNPTAAVFDGFYPNGFMFAAVSGEGNIAGVDPIRPSLPAAKTRVGSIKDLITGFTH